MLAFFPRDVLDEIWDLIEPVSEGSPIYSLIERIFQREYSLYIAFFTSDAIRNLNLWSY